MVRLPVPILLILFCLLSDLYVLRYYIKTKSVWRWTWFIPLLVVCGFFVRFLFFNSGLEQEYNITNLFLLVMGVVCIPKIVFLISSGITRMCRAKSKRNTSSTGQRIADGIGIVIGLGLLYILIYGVTLGFADFKVKRVTFESPNVPEAFDGYKIAMFADAHVGSFRGPYYDLLKESCDTINNLHPDLICFVGDIHNFGPSEEKMHAASFASLKAKDGVFSVMGNHDYSEYVKAPKAEQKAKQNETEATEKSFGWIMLDNDHRVIHRGNDSIYVIGEKNWGFPPFQQYGDVKQAIAGLNPNTLSEYNGKKDAKGAKPTFSIMLSHDPNAWEAHILPIFRPDITLAGHTHGTQFSIFGWCPSSVAYEHWGNEYHRNPATDNGGKGYEVDRENLSDIPTLLYVTTGFGGNFPFRFGMPREVVLITLKHKK